MLFVPLRISVTAGKPLFLSNLWNHFDKRLTNNVTHLRQPRSLARPGLMPALPCPAPRPCLALRDVQSGDRETFNELEVGLAGSGATLPPPPPPLPRLPILFTLRSFHSVSRSMHVVSAQGPSLALTQREREREVQREEERGEGGKGRAGERRN